MVSKGLRVGFRVIFFLVYTSHLSCDLHFTTVLLVHVTFQLFHTHMHTQIRQKRLQEILAKRKYDFPGQTDKAPSQSKLIMTFLQSSFHAITWFNSILTYFQLCHVHYNHYNNKRAQMNEQGQYPTHGIDCQGVLKRSKTRYTACITEQVNNSLCKQIVLVKKHMS